MDKIKNSETWKELLINPKFRQKFEECLKTYSYYANTQDLQFKVSDNKLIITYNSKIRNSDLKCQYKLFDQTEFFLDDNNNLIVNCLSGRFESDKGFKFKETSGGIINTHYSYETYDNDGIELAFGRYDDKYAFDKIEYNSFMEDFQSVILGAYNPELASQTTTKGVYPYPKVIGTGSQFIRYIRSIDNLGVVEVTKYSFNKGIRVCDKEYYFSVLPNKEAIYTPELIHIIPGDPFARLDDDSNMKIEEKYLDLGLTENNYLEVAKERFLKELEDGKDKAYAIDEIIIKYDLMIDKVERKEKIKKRTR